jgi:hypothetical protein
LYVEGLKENLLSISQFCDSDLVVRFSKKECNIFDSSGKWLMGGERTADNCYGLPGLTIDPQIFCNKATIDDIELWHQRLGHLNFSDMLKIAGKDIVRSVQNGEDWRRNLWFLPTRETDSSSPQEDLRYSNFQKFRITAHGSHGSH